MANLSETSTWETGIYQLEVNDPVDAGVGGNGVSNLQAKQLANRTTFLKNVVDGHTTDNATRDTRLTTLENTGVITIGGRKYRSIIDVSGNLTLNQTTHAGCLLMVTTPGINITIMPPGSATNGATYAIYNFSGGSINILQGVDSNNLLLPSGNMSLEDGDYVELVQRRFSSIKLEFYVSSLRKNNDSVKPGTVIAFAASSPPSGWLACNGAAVSQTTYSTLFSVVGTTFNYLGSPGTGNFRLPDLRGEFIRGWDNGRGADPSRVLGSEQAATEINEHVSSDGSNLVISMLNHDSSLPYNITGRVETASGSNLAYDRKSVRPRNVALLYCIKY